MSIWFIYKNDNIKLEKIVHQHKIVADTKTGAYPTLCLPHMVVSMFPP